jgi:hypothetical protein
MIACQHTNARESDLTHNNGRAQYANDSIMTAVSMKLDRTTRDRLWKFALGTVPWLRGAEMYDLLRDLRRSQTDFDQQVTEAVEALQNTAWLVSRLQQGVEERMAKLQQVRTEYDKYSLLAQIEAKKAEPLLLQVEATLGREQRKERWIAFCMHMGFGLLFFILGIAVSDSLKGWMDHLWTKVFH